VNDQPLPLMPEQPPAPAVPRGVHLSRFTPAKRVHCSDCVEQIHRLGVGLAALPRAVRWRLSINSLSLYLCEQHKNERLEKMK